MSRKVDPILTMMRLIEGMAAWYYKSSSSMQEIMGGRREGDKTGERGGGEKYMVCV